jgi:ATP-dependent exoDNAse (exonuclease V) alpha subunit
VQALKLEHEQHWDHAYASTVHAAQGRTAERVILHLDTTQPQLLGHESFYVGLSRARREVAIFTDNVDRLPLVIGKSLAQASALEGVAAHERGGLEVPR